MNLRTNQRGLSLIELMVALLLGLLVTGSAIAIFATNRKTYAATESLGRIQENSRLAYEMMARDLRSAGGTACAKNLPMANVASTAGAQWWQTWGGGLTGFHYGDAGVPGTMKSGTDGVILMESDDSPISVVSHTPGTKTFTLNVSPAAYKAMDLVVACDYRQASLFQINGVVAGASPPYKLTYAKSGLNCTADLSMPANCASVRNGIQYGNQAMVARVRAVRWYVNANNQLIQEQLVSDGASSTPPLNPQQIADGVTNLQLTYLLNTGTDYVAASAVGGNWSSVVAVRVALTLQGQDNGQGQALTSNTNGTITRTLTHVVSLRNHLQ